MATSAWLKPSGSSFKPSSRLRLSILNRRSSHWHYRMVSRHALWLWSAEFRFTDTPSRALLAHHLFTHMMARRLHRMLDEIQPDAVITTYPFLSYEVQRVIQNRSEDTPVALVFSDPYRIHATWLTERQVAATYATTRETYAEALAAGFPSEKLHLVGWPVRSQFRQNHTSSRLRVLSSLGLESGRFTVFLQGGHEGAAQFDRVVDSVLAANPDLQIILAIGTNEASGRRFHQVANVGVLPFRRDIAPYMAAADVIMGKSGPNILFESVMLGKPFIASTCIPGQEQATLEFIRRHDLGWVALEPYQQRKLIAMLATDSS